jgi:hypothetical protein
MTSAQLLSIAIVSALLACKATWRSRQQAFTILLASQQLGRCMLLTARRCRGMRCGNVQSYDDCAGSSRCTSTTPSTST